MTSNPRGGLAAHARAVFAAVGAAALLAAAAPAYAQSSAGLAGFENGLAPGYQSPEFETRPNARVGFRPFGEKPNGDWLDTDTDTPINEFAGQTRKFEPGIIGGLLGQAKNSVLGQ